MGISQALPAGGEVLSERRSRKPATENQQPKTDRVHEAAETSRPSQKSHHQKPATGNRHKRHFAPRGAAARLKGAIAKAGEMREALKKGKIGIEELATATLLQGIVSGDVISASIITRQRLQRENLRLRMRLAAQKLRESRAQERLLHVHAEKEERQISHHELTRRIREIYGLELKPQTENRQPTTENRQPTTENRPQPPQLPEAPENTPENRATLPQDESPGTGQGPNTPENCSGGVTAAAEESKTE